MDFDHGFPPIVQNLAGSVLPPDGAGSDNFLDWTYQPFGRR
jgi:hypothetical protein